MAEEGEKYSSKKGKKLSKKDKELLLAKLQKEMEQAAKDLEFEKAAHLRDMIEEIKEKQFYR